MHKITPDFFHTPIPDIVDSKLSTPSFKLGASNQEGSHVDNFKWALLTEWD
jgi:hypothetical protein